jgi:hypothetical protein
MVLAPPGLGKRAIAPHLGGGAMARSRLQVTYPLHVSVSDWKKFRDVLALNGHTAKFVLTRFVRSYGTRREREELALPGGSDAERN